jgi:hypothetical protein
MSDERAPAPLDLIDVLLEECKHIHGPIDEQFAPNGSETARLKAVQRLLHRKRQWALCLSGGGIRSATFGLGIIEGLAKLGLLDRFHYLSTVSGGGYVGGWLTAWMHRHPDGMDGVIRDLQAWDPERSVYRVESKSDSDPLIRPEPDAIRHLRKYGNYLTPKMGAMSTDTWTGVATYLRNLILHWLVLIPMLLGAVLVPRFAAGLVTLPALLEQQRWTRIGTSALLLLGIALLLIAISAVGTNRPSAMPPNGPDRPSATNPDSGSNERRRGLDQRGFLRLCLLPTLGAGIMLSLAWAWWPSEGWSWMPGRNTLAGLPGGNPSWTWQATLMAFAVVGAVLRVVPCLISVVKRTRLPAPDNKAPERHLLAEVAAAAAAGLLGGVVIGLIACVAFPQPTGSPTSSQQPIGAVAAYVTFATPAIIAAFLASETLFVGITSFFTTDDDREWWGRSGAWLLIAVVAWLASAGISLYGSAVLVSATAWGMTALAAGGGSAGLAVVKWGASAATPARNGPTNPATAAAIALLPLVFVVVLLAFLALLLDAALAPSGIGATFHAQIGLSESVNLLQVTTAAAVLIAVCWPMSYFVNINKFSLHAMYRYRLIRAYLGASNLRRKPNRFTGFDPKDNIDMRNLWPNPRQDRPPSRQPFHIVNMALNLVSGSNYAWQQRKAAPFIVSPLHSGSWYIGYRRSGEYGHPQEGISLGTAVAISGAAASPNMGYHSSPVISFLMTLFNIRLGWWLGNPGKRGSDTWRKPGPRKTLTALLSELLGLTDWRNPYVYLSDGGHFDNLGLYEMVLRRCRLIVISDASADPNFEFFDLGMAIRKIRIDLGVEIEMGPLPIRLPREKLREAGAAIEAASRYAAIGRIDYPECPGEPGYVFYLKPGVYGDETADVQDYAMKHTAFPHDTTGDQWFDEPQFESYRRLGQFVVRAIFGAPPAQPPLEYQLDRLREIMTKRGGKLELGATWLA